jgi:hypothetical protein
MAAAETKGSSLFQQFLLQHQAGAATGAATAAAATPSAAPMKLVESDKCREPHFPDADHVFVPHSAPPGANWKEAFSASKKFELRPPRSGIDYSGRVRRIPLNFAVRILDEKQCVIPIKDIEKAAFTCTNPSCCHTLVPLLVTLVGYQTKGVTTPIALNLRVETKDKETKTPTIVHQWSMPERERMADSKWKSSRQITWFSGQADARVILLPGLVSNAPQILWSDEDASISRLDTLTAILTKTLVSKTIMTDADERVLVCQPGASNECRNWASYYLTRYHVKRQRNGTCRMQLQSQTRMMRLDSGKDVEAWCVPKAQMADMVQQVKEEHPVQKMTLGSADSLVLDLVPLSSTEMFDVASPTLVVCIELVVVVIGGQPQFDY